MSDGRLLATARVDVKLAGRRAARASRRLAAPGGAAANLAISHPAPRGSRFASLAVLEVEMDARIFEELVADPRARRELLWLRAKEKGDDRDAREIERVDPSVVARLRAAGFDVDVRGDDERGGRRERFGRMMDERQEQHMERLAREAASRLTGQ